jgi:hypothetical protein
MNREVKVKRMRKIVQKKLKMLKKKKVRKNDLENY